MKAAGAVLAVGLISVVGAGLAAIGANLSGFDTAQTFWIAWPIMAAYVSVAVFVLRR